MIAKVASVFLGFSIAQLAGCVTSSNTQTTTFSKVVDKNKLAELEKKATEKNLQDFEVTELFLAADVLAANKEFESADRMYTAVFAADPSIPVGLKLSRIKRIAGKEKEAEDIVKKLELLFPKHYEPPLELATIYLAKQNNVAAQKELEVAYKRLPDSEELALAYIDSLIQVKQRDKAKLVLSNALKINPTSDILLLRSVRIKAEDKDYKAAKEDLNTLIRTSPENIETWTLAGLVAAEEGNFDAAERYFREAFERRPESDVLARYFVLQLIKQEKYEEARRILLKLESANDDEKNTGFDPELRYQLAFVSMQLDEIVDARSRFSSLLSVSTDAGRLLFYIGQCDELLKNQTSAKEQYSKVLPTSLFYQASQQRLLMIDIDSGAIEAAKTRLHGLNEQRLSDESDYRFLANAHAKLKNYKKALEILKSGLKKFPKSADISYFIAAYSEFTESRRASLIALENFIKHNPNYIQALNHLGYSLAEIGERLPFAEQLLRKATSRDPKNAFYLDSLGWVLFKQKKYSEAETVLLQAIKIEKDEPIVYEHLGEVKYAQKDFASALKFFQRADQIFTEKPTWKIENDPEWKSSFTNIRRRILEIQRMAQPEARS